MLCLWRLEAAAEKRAQRQNTGKLYQIAIVCQWETYFHAVSGRNADLFARIENGRIGARFSKFLAKHGMD